MEENGNHKYWQDQENGRDLLIISMPEWKCPLCGADSVIQRVSKFENTLKCKECEWQRDLNFA
jgi:predicted RNA-binding Zn-ribbon protein involved in translation (DUF1610 family)